MFIHDLDGEPRYFGHYWGTVFDNADPDKLGRVRVHVPGVLEPAGPWAHQAGGAHSSGAKGLGSYDVPPLGATVLVGFHAGDVDVPYYFAAHHGRGEQLSVGPSAAADADKIKVFESARFLVVLNGIGSSEEALIKDKETGDLISVKPEVLTVKSATKVVIDSPDVRIGSAGASQKFVNGNDWKTMMESLFDAIAGLTVATAFGPSSPPLNTAAFTALKANLIAQLSTKIFGE